MLNIICRSFGVQGARNSGAPVSIVVAMERNLQEKLMELELTLGKLY